MGVVSPVGEQGSVIAKTAALKAGWDFRVAGMQINRFCASGLEAVNLAAQKVASGWEDLVVAGGVESMSRVPIGSDGGAWAQDPADQLRHRLRAAGHRRRPDRHARTAGAARTSTRFALDLAAARRGGAGRGPLRPLGASPSTTRSACRCSSATSSSSRAPRSKAWPSSRSPSPTWARWASTRWRWQRYPAGRAHRPRAHGGQLVGHRRRRGGGADRQRGQGPCARPDAARRASSPRRCRAPTRPSCSPARCRPRARRWPRRA